MRRPGYATPGFLIIAILLLVSFAGARPALAFQDASPAAGTPAPAPQPTQAPAPAETPAATPAAAPAAPAQTDVVTLVLWYNNPVDAELIDLFPLSTDAGFVASPAQGAASVGTVDFPADGVTPPSVVVGDTTFETYPRPDGVIERWTWLDDFEGARPATLVMQLSGISGQYQNYFGTGTFMSRDEGGAGGVLILALRPPNPAAVAEEEAAAEEQPAEEAAAEEQPAAETADAAEADTGIVIEGEAPAEGEAPVEGEAPAA
jgi:hypothetical protein